MVEFQHQKFQADDIHKVHSLTALSISGKDGLYCLGISGQTRSCEGVVPGALAPATASYETGGMPPNGMSMTLLLPVFIEHCIYRVSNPGVGILSTVRRSLVNVQCTIDFNLEVDLVEVNRGGLRIPSQGGR